MGFGSYLPVLRKPAVTRILVLGFCVRMPQFATIIVLTLHVVDHLEKSYAAAGVVSMVGAGAMAVAGPWRGMKLDRLGLRRALLPSLFASAAVASLAPWVGYWALLIVIAVGGVFLVPIYSIVRMVLIDATTEEERKAALSIDSTMTEMSYMLGPLLGVTMATFIPTTWTLLICQSAVLIGAIALWVTNPRLVTHREAGTAPKPPRREWLTFPVMFVFGLSWVCSVVLYSEELSTIAGLKALDHQGSVGWMLTLWSLTSLLGGLLYGALRKHPSMPALAVCLGASTVLVSFADSQLVFLALLMLSGFFCAPTLTSSIDALSRLVPASRRGEAMGWHGTSMNLGASLGAPITGTIIDAGSWHSGFLFPGLAGLVMAVIGFVVYRSRLSTHDESVAAAH